MKLKFKLWLEAFNTPTDFLLNPENKYKTWPELLSEFVADGGKVFYGKYGKVCMHSSWPYVIKIFDSDNFYLKFARFAYKNPHPSFPKLFGPPQIIVPFYRRSAQQTKLYVARMERLNEVKDKAMLKDIVLNYTIGIQYFDAVERGDENNEYEEKVFPNSSQRKAGILPYNIKVKHFQRIFDMFQKYPQIKNLFEAIWIVSRNLEGALDIHSDNIMQRDNGELVLTDPLWPGSNPYMDAAAARKMEYDGYSGEYDEPELNVLGGQFPKKPRKKPIKQSIKPQQDYSSEVPF